MAVAQNGGRFNGNNISDVYSKQDVYPLVVSFQNGILHRAGESDLCGGIYSENSSGKKTKKVIVALDGMIYAGQETEDNVCRNLIVARNRNTGAMRLIEVGNVLLKAIPESEQVTHKEESTDVTDYLETKQRLGEAFGSKRQKRILEQSKKNKIDVDSMKEQLEKTVKENQLDDLDMSQHEPANSETMMEKYAPPMNRDASSVQEVFNVNDFLNEEQFETLRITAKSVLEDRTFEIEMSDYISEEIFALRSASTSTDAEKLDICCLLLYADCIIRYLKEPYKSVTSSNYVVCKYSELIDKLTLSNFSAFTEKGRARPNSLKDKACCYLLVLLLLAGNYKILNANKLTKAVALTLPKITQMVKVIGGRSIKDGDNTKVVLSLPLAPPPTIMLGKRTRT